jgi:hypothetical protein
MGNGFDDSLGMRRGKTRSIAHRGVGEKRVMHRVFVRIRTSSCRGLGRHRRLLAVGLAIVATACAGPPTRWEKAGVADATADEADCRTAALQEAVRRLPYGNGPPIFFYPKISMLQWTQAIDNERSYLADRLTALCMREKGFEPVVVR